MWKRLTTSWSESPTSTYAHACYPAPACSCAGSPRWHLRNVPGLLGGALHSNVDENGVACSGGRAECQVQTTVVMEADKFQDQREACRHTNLPVMATTSSKLAAATTIEGSSVANGQVAQVRRMECSWMHFNRLLAEQCDAGMLTCDAPFARPRRMAMTSNMSWMTSAGPTALRMKPMANANSGGMPNKATPRPPSKNASTIPGMNSSFNAGMPTRLKTYAWETVIYQDQLPQHKMAENACGRPDGRMPWLH